MKTRKPGRKALIVILLAIFAIMSVACQPEGISPEEAQAIADTAAQKAAEEVLANLPTPAPTSTPTPEKELVIGSNIITHTMTGDIPGWSISGVPETVDISNLNLSELHTHAEMANRPLTGAIAWTAIPGGERWSGDPGVYNTHDNADAESNESAWLITPLSQHLFTQELETVPVGEGAYTWVNACGMTVRIIQEQEGKDVVLIEATLDCAPGHAWFLVVNGLGRDYKTPYDKNLSLEVELNEAFGHAQMFPPGSKLAYGYLNDNVNSAMLQNSCGADGCYPGGISIMFIDPETGAFSISHKSSVEAEYNFVTSNTGYEAIAK